MSESFSGQSISHSGSSSGDHECLWKTLPICLIVAWVFYPGPRILTYKFYNFRTYKWSLIRETSSEGCTTEEVEREQNKTCNSGNSIYSFLVYCFKVYVG